MGARERRATQSQAIGWNRPGPDSRGGISKFSNRFDHLMVTLGTIASVQWEQSLYFSSTTNYPRNASLSWTRNSEFYENFTSELERRDEIRNMHFSKDIMMLKKDSNTPELTSTDLQWTFARSIVKSTCGCSCIHLYHEPTGHSCTSSALLSPISVTRELNGIHVALYECQFPSKQKRVAEVGLVTSA